MLTNLLISAVKRHEKKVINPSEAAAEGRRNNVQTPEINENY